MKRKFLKLKHFIAITVLLFSLVLTSCSDLHAFSDFVKVVDDYTTTKFSFYTYKEESTLPEGQELKILSKRLKIGKPISSEDLIQGDISELIDLRPGYRVGDWMLYRYTKDKTLTLSGEGNSALGYVVTADEIDVVADWYYQYTVNFYYEKNNYTSNTVVEGSSEPEIEYDLISSETRYGKPGSTTQVEAPEVEGFIAEPITQIVIEEGEIKSVDIKYKRKIVTITLNPNGGKFRLRRSSAEDDIPYSTDPIVVTGKYGNNVYNYIDTSLYYDTNPVHDEYSFNGYEPNYWGTFPTKDTEYIAKWGPPYFNIEYADYSKLSVFGANFSGKVLDDNYKELLPSTRKPGEKTYIPVPVAKGKCSENPVTFIKWYYYESRLYDFITLGDFKELPSDSGGYYIPSEVNDSVRLFAKWNFKYIYLKPDNLNDSLSDNHSGFTPDDAFTSVYQAVEKFMNSESAESILLMGSVTTASNINYMKSYSFKIQQASKYPCYKRYTDYKGPMIEYTKLETDEDFCICNMILDGGADWASNNPSSKINNGLKSESPLIVLHNADNVHFNEYCYIDSSTGEINVSGDCNVILRNNNVSISSLPDGYDIIPSAIYVDGTSLSAEDLTVERCSSTVGGVIQPTVYATEHKGYNFTNCIIQNNISDGLWIYPDESEPLSLTDSKIINNINYGIRSFGNLNIGNMTYEISDNAEADIYIPQNKSAEISGTSLPVITFYLDCASNDKDTSAYLDLPDGYSPGVSTVARVKVPYPQIAPKVLKGDSSVVSANYKKFLCMNEGYTINSVGIIGESKDIKITPESPSVTQYDLGYIADTGYGSEIPKTIVVKKGVSDTKIKFIVNEDTMQYIKDWGDNKYLQYTINGMYSCVKIENDGTNNYAMIDFIKLRASPTAGQSDFNLSSGIHNLSIYADPSDSETVAFKPIAVQVLYMTE